METTDKNLAAAFAGESQANRKYLFFAAKAEAQGQPQIARLFRAAAEAETVHARNHLNVLDGIGDTAENLRSAIAGESYEFTQMYPGFIDQAKQDADPRAEMSFTSANAVEKVHHGLFQKAMNDLDMGRTGEAQPYFVCQVCGNTVLGQAPDICPICGSARLKFRQID